MKMQSKPTLGVELEYMIVDRRSLAVVPAAPRLLRAFSGNNSGDVARGEVDWSNELVSHVVEFKVHKPVRTLAGLSARFNAEVRHASKWLEQHGLMLLPTAMHPTMRPLRETKLWPYGNREIYRAFDRIFNCRGHGWSNLQSAHLNIGFEDDSSFASLHAAARVLLPLLPALAASSPYAEGRRTRYLDSRLNFYRNNCRRIPQMTAGVIPEVISSEAEYQKKILEPIYSALRRFDRRRILMEEWSNARGAIARFSRGAIEIRVLDVQECPSADLAIHELVLAAIARLRNRDWQSLNRHPTAALKTIFKRCMTDGDEAKLTKSELPFAPPGLPRSFTAREFWLAAHAAYARPSSELTRWIKCYGSEGCLASRIVRRVGRNANRDRIVEAYRDLGRCLLSGTLFSE